MHVMSIKYSENPVGLSNHYHNCHQIIYIVSGSVSVKVNDKQIKAESGSVVILSRFEEHSIKVLSEEYKRYYLNISSERAQALHENNLLSSVLVNRPKNFYHTVNVSKFSHIFETLLRNMTEEYKNKSVMYEDILDLGFREFMINLYRIAPDIFTPNINRNTSLIYQIQKKFELEYKENFTLEELSAEYHISKYHLARLFKSVTGYAPVEYLLACRMSAAKKYLCTTNLSVKEIVDSCGFGDESNFCRMFKSKTGFTPLQYRKIHCTKY